VRRIAIAAVLAAVAGCASQQIVQQEFYEPTAETLHKRADGHSVGALKSETTKTGAPDWSGNKSFSIIGIGN
jgi:Tfp pilus assembly protein FimT